jgi:putative transposase
MNPLLNERISKSLDFVNPNMGYTAAMEIYHVFNRGVEKRDLFMDQRDYVRFVHDLWEFNDSAATSHAIHTFKNLDLRNPNFPDRPERQIVDLHAWCLMKNHYHLLLSECAEGGLTLFLRKLNIGYANYFNERYNRSGSLFQGRTKKVHVNSDAYFIHILNYVHFNPLDYFAKGRDWRTRSLTNPVQAHEYLLRYRWSSYMDYCGERNFPSLISKDLFDEKPAVFKKHIFDYSGLSHEKIPTQFLLE